MVDLKDDAEIWREFKKGKREALSQIYFENIQVLYRYGKGFTTDEELIKDTIQDLFYDLIRTKQTLSDTDNIKYYLIVAFRRKLIKNLNLSNKFVRGDSTLNFSRKEESCENVIIRDEYNSNRSGIINKALNKLSPKQQEIIFFRYTCNFDYEQICLIMELKYDSARKQLNRALKALRILLKEVEFVFLLGMFFF